MQLSFSKTVQGQIDELRFLKAKVNEWYGVKPSKLKVGMITELKRITTSGVILKATPNKTTTVLGTYLDDTRHIISELNLPKSTDLGARNGGFNVLNIPDHLYKNPNQFWDEYNKPWLDNIIKRGDDIILATELSEVTLYRTIQATGKKELMGFGREYFYLTEQHGYKLDIKTMQMIKGQ